MFDKLHALALILIEQNGIRIGSSKAYRTCGSGTRPRKTAAAAAGLKERIFQVEVSFLEGNSSNRVKDTRKWDGLIAFTFHGSQWIYWHRGADKTENTIDDVGIKLYGFGIDLDESGAPIYDETRLHYIEHKFMRHPSIVISGGAGVIGLELFSGASTVSGVLLTGESIKTLYFPHVASNGT